MASDEFAALNSGNTVADAGAQFRLVGGKRAGHASGRSWGTVPRPDVPHAAAHDALLPDARGVRSFRLLRTAALLQPDESARTVAGLSDHIQQAALHPVERMRHRRCDYGSSAADFRVPFGC